MIGLIHRANVYEPGSSGEFNQLTRSNLPCRLQEGRSMTVPTLPFADRSEASRLVWLSDYAMPDVCQIELAHTSVRYTIQIGTQDDVIGPTGAVVAHRANVVRLGNA